MRPVPKDDKSHRSHARKRRPLRSANNKLNQLSLSNRPDERVRHRTCSDAWEKSSILHLSERCQTEEASWMLLNQRWRMPWLFIKATFRAWRRLWSDLPTCCTHTSVCLVHCRSRWGALFSFSLTGKTIMWQLQPAYTDAFIKTGIGNPLVWLRRMRKVDGLELESLCPWTLGLCVTG